MLLHVVVLFLQSGERHLQLGGASAGEQQMLGTERVLMANPRLSIVVVDGSLAELATLVHGVVLADGETVWSSAMDGLDDDVPDPYSRV